MVVPSDVQIDCMEDRPASGMWHCGPNPFWITITHKPTGNSVRLYSGEKTQHKTMQEALEILELILSFSPDCVPSFPERLKP